MYIVKDHQGNIVVIASRKEDAVAMTMTIGSESKKILEKK